jgi:phosphatidylserine decarboxylase
MLPLREWLASPEYLAVKKLSMGDLVSKEFFRDPLRPTYIMPEYFFSPADGTVLYVFDNIKPKDALIRIKGKKYTVQDALDDKDYNYNSIFISIFMSQADCHVNRICTSGYIKQERITPYLFTNNLSMISEEQDILEEADIKTEDMGYVFQNERVVMSVYYPRIRQIYYLVQIAEKDVDVICNFTKQGFLIQSERYGIVRFGSEVQIVIPLINKEIKYEILAKRGYHIEAGIDRIIKIL